MTRRSAKLTARRAGRRVRLYRRRATSYVAVLGATTIVSIIGMSALFAMRVELRATRQAEDAALADAFSTSMIEVYILRTSQVANWRSSEVNGAWSADETADGVRFSYKLVDEVDGDLANDPTQPVRLYARARVGDAVRTHSVLLRALGANDGVYDIPVVAAFDDAEENGLTGIVYRTSPSLQLADDALSWNTDAVGIRFVNVEIPQGAAIASAFVQFQAAAGVNTGAVDLTIRGEDTDHASPFGLLLFNISSRSTTSQFVSWSPPDWNSVGVAGVDQRTPDLSAVLQEIVDRSGWQSGNAMVLIFTGTGTRSAEAFDGNGSAAPVLHVELAGSGNSFAPVPGSWRRNVAP